MLEIKNLKIEIENKEVLKGLDLNVKNGEIHVLMGPNGAGKSTICKAIMKYPNYKITEGTILYDEEDITKKSTNEIASMGLYYISQTPVEIEGITNAEALRLAMSSQKKSVDIFTFNKKCTLICEKLKMPKNFLHRPINVGMSGGERKKNELLGMWLLEPSFLLLDEIDSGLDVDAIKIVSENLKEYHEQTNASMLIITHQQSIIDLLKPDYVHILKDGKIEESGNLTLAKKIEKEGFLEKSRVNIVSESGKNE